MRHIWQLLRRCLRQAVLDELMVENPADKFHYTIGKDITAQTLTALEVEDYLNATEKLGYLAMFTLALTSGLRESELIALQWSDLDSDKGEITVWEERKVRYGKLTEYGNRKRVIPLPCQTVELLVKEHEKHPNSPWMFPHPGTCKPYSPTMIRRLHGIILGTAGLDHIRLEDLRHTFAVNSLREGIKPKALSAMLGHDRPDVIARKYRPHLQKEIVVEPTKAICEASLEELQKAAVKMEFMLPVPLT